MANLSHYGSDALADVHNHDNVNNNMINQAVQVMLSSEQSNVVNHLEIEITSDSNIIPYSQYVIESQQTASVEIERLKQTLSEHLKEKESLIQTVSSLKDDFKKEESRNIDREIALEKRIKQLDNIENNPIGFTDSEETCCLLKKSRSKMLLKQKDPMMLEKKVNTTPVDYATLNQLYKDFKTRFVPQTELCAEQPFWSQNSMNSPEPILSSRPTIVEVSKELPKVSMVNTSLKKLKHHLAGFDVVVKERTTPTAITEDTVIKKLKERIKALSGKKNKDKIKQELEEIETINIELDHRVTKLIAENEHLKQTYKQLYDSIKPARIRSKEQCDDLINQVNIKSVEISDLNARLQEKVLVITALKNDLRKLKGKDLADNAVTKHTIDPEMLKIDVEYLNPRLLNNRSVHSNYIKHTQEEAATLREIVEQGKSQNPLNTSLDSALGNACPLTRITTTTEVPLRKSTALDNETSKLVVTLVYSKKLRKSKTNVSVSKSKVVQIVLWYLDSGCSKHMTGDRSQLTNFINKFLGTVKFRNDHVAKILGYGDYQIRNVTISRVYYVEGLRHNLFSVGRFCDSNLKVAFRQHTCFIRNLEGVDLLTGSRGNNLYTLSLGDMMASSPICLLSKASKTKSWLWHRRLSHLNFGAINHLARHGLVRGLPKLKFEKDHLCSACAMGKSKKKPHKPKSKDTNQEKLYLLHMDLCGPMRVASVNGKKSKDEAPDFIIKFLKMIQVRLKVPVRRIKTDNGTEFVNKPLREYYEKVGISHETSVARSLWQNGVVERRNRTLIEAARTMLIYVKALLFLWAEEVATACYTKNRSVICLHHGKTPYELLDDKPPDLSFFHIFRTLCYPTNDSENLGKLQQKSGIGTLNLSAGIIFKCTQMIKRTAMASVDNTSGLVPQRK
ncbi:retrovirus-related pol polyprotein from transposon TNT 1-94 [Tanacetum coccineum]